MSCPRLAAGPTPVSPSPTWIPALSCASASSSSIPREGELRRAGRRVPLQHQPLRALVAARRRGRAGRHPRGAAGGALAGRHPRRLRPRHQLLPEPGARRPARPGPRVAFRRDRAARGLPLRGRRARGRGRRAAPAARPTAPRRRPRPLRWLAFACARRWPRRPGDRPPARGGGAVRSAARDRTCAACCSCSGRTARRHGTRRRAPSRRPRPRAHVAAAQAGLARVLVGLGQAGLRPAAECLPRARVAALAALREDPRLADAWVSLSLVRLHLDWDWLASEDIDRALALEPDLARAHRARAAYLSARGDRDGAIAAARRAAALDPLCPAAAWRPRLVLLLRAAIPGGGRGVADERGGAGRRRPARPAGRRLPAPRPARSTPGARRRPRCGTPGSRDRRSTTWRRRGPEAALRAFLSGSAAYLARHGRSARAAGRAPCRRGRGRAGAVAARAGRRRAGLGSAGSPRRGPRLRALEGRPRYTPAPARDRPAWARSERRPPGPSLSWPTKPLRRLPVRGLRIP